MCQCLFQCETEFILFRYFSIQTFLMWLIVFYKWWNKKLCSGSFPAFLSVHQPGCLQLRRRWQPHQWLHVLPGCQTHFLNHSSKCSIRPPKPFSASSSLSGNCLLLLPHLHNLRGLLVSSCMNCALRWLFLLFTWKLNALAVRSYILCNFLDIYIHDRASQIDYKLITLY